MENIFEPKTAQQYITRIGKLSKNTAAIWGKMNAAQMLAHCNVAYETVFEPKKYPKTGFITGLFLRQFLKQKTVNETPYKKHMPTAAILCITDERNFEEEKKRLIGFIQKTQQLGRTAFEGKESYSFGKLTAEEWDNMFAKHLNHHLQQFGV